MGRWGDGEMGRGGEGETRGQGEMGGQGDKEELKFLTPYSQLPNAQLPNAQFLIKLPFKNDHFGAYYWTTGY